MGCYRRGEAENADVYVAAVAAVLSQFPEAVARKITDPVRGLPAKSQWLPSVAEVRAACDEEMGPIYRQQQRDRQATASWQQLAAPAGPTPEERLRAVEHWESEVRPTLRGAPPKENHAETETRLRNRGLKDLHLGSEITKILDAMRSERGAA